MKHKFRHAAKENTPERRRHGDSTERDEDMIEYKKMNRKDKYHEREERQVSKLKSYVKTVSKNDDIRDSESEARDYERHKETGRSKWEDKNRDYYDSSKKDRRRGNEHETEIVRDDSENREHSEHKEWSQKSHEERYRYFNKRGGREDEHNEKARDDSEERERDKQKEVSQIAYEERSRRHVKENSKRERSKKDEQNKNVRVDSEERDHSKYKEVRKISNEERSGRHFKESNKRDKRRHDELNESASDFEERNYDNRKIRYEDRNSDQYGSTSRDKRRYYEFEKRDDRSRQRSKFFEGKNSSEVEMEDLNSHHHDSLKRKRDKHFSDSPEQGNDRCRRSDNQKSQEMANPDKNDEPQSDNVEPLSKRQKMSNINMRTGGAYIPPARLKMMQEQIKDKGCEAYQRIAWEALKKSIVGMTNKVNASNIAEIVPELFKENIIRGRGILSRAVMQAQAVSPTFTRVYSALVAIINTKFPEIGELILKRLILQYKRAFRRNDKNVCNTAARFLAHLLNQEVAHEVLMLEIVTHLLENPTNDSVEIAIATLKECGKKLTQLTPRGMRAITQRVRDVLHEGNVDIRVRYMIEVFFAVQKDGFKDFEIIPAELDLVQEDDKYTHLITLDDAVASQDILNIFKFDPNYEENEEKYKSVVKEILGDSSDEEQSGNESDSEGEEDEENKGEDGQKIIDMTETNIVCLRRKIYLTVQSSLDFEECAHKLLKLELKPGQILEMCYMILDCCAQQRTYEKFFGLLAQRFCQLNKIYVEPFTEIFENSYTTIHRLETNKLRNVAKFFAHLLYTDAISWMVLAIIKLNEEDTTSSSRIFIKILFQELCEYMGLPKLNDRVKDVTLQEAFNGLFPRDHPHNTRFAINFFTSIGLGGLTDELREHLKNLPKNPLPTAPTVTKSSSSSSDSSDSSNSSSSSSSSSSSTNSDSEESTPPKRQKKKVEKKKKK